MRRMIVLIALGLLLAAPAYAGGFAVQPRLSYGLLKVTDANWDEVYARAPHNAGYFTVDSELLVGIGPYVSLGGWKAHHKIQEMIDVDFGAFEAAAGLSYRLTVVPWFMPAVHFGALSITAHETIKDSQFKYDMDSQTFGYEGGIDLNFYPLAGLEGPEGLGLVVGAAYQYRPLKKMGDLKNASGYLFTIGLQYRFDIDRMTAPAKPARVTPPAEPPAPPAPEPGQ